MFIFDFSDTSEDAINDAAQSINLGIIDALEAYSFLTGRLGRLHHPTKQNPIQLRYGDAPYAKSTLPYIVRWAYHKDEGDSSYGKLCEAGMPVAHWKMDKFCAAPKDVDHSAWPPAFTMQTSFLKSGSLGVRRLQHMTGGLFGDSLTYVRGGIRAELDFSHHGSIDGQFGTDGMANPDPDNLTTCIFKMPQSTAVDWADILAWDICLIPTADCVIVLILVEITKAAHATSSAPMKETRVFNAVSVRRMLTSPDIKESCFGGSMPVKRYATHADVAVRLYRSTNAIGHDVIQRRLTALNRFSDPSTAFKYHDEESRFNKIWFIYTDEAAADIDFNIPGTRGRPEWVCWPWEHCNNTVTILPRQDEGDWEIHVCLEKWHMDVLRENLLADERWDFTVVENSYSPIENIQKVVCEQPRRENQIEKRAGKIDQERQVKS
ncbi:hypothetical protein GGR53DRAFT_533258 [Hypoxylon sp. FL1150]|nr:hypothetical protein GGR53DRAFT_533258 [Hypoxylon sp. FL1150]